MAKPNYAYEKRQRELAKRQKQEAKRQRKATTGHAAPDGDERDESAEAAVSPGTPVPPPPSADKP